MGVKFEKKGADAASPEETPVVQSIAQDAGTATADDTPFDHSVPAKAPVAAKPGKAKKAKAPKIEKVQPQAVITTKHSSGVETTEVEKVGEEFVKTEPMANVGLSIGYTHGLPNYSNIKFSVSLFMPSATDEESLTETFKKVEAWVDDRMVQLRKDLTGDDE